jgi:5-keto 4-deoxyuronate isomerase
MQDIKGQPCPLCRTDAKFYFVDYENRKYFDCENCNRYQISIGAERYLTTVGSEILLEISKFASQSEDNEAAVILLSSAASTEYPQEKISITRAKKSELKF